MRSNAPWPGTPSSSPSASRIGGRATLYTIPRPIKSRSQSSKQRLRAGEFVVTAEVAPPVTIATSKLTKNIDLVKPYVAAINFTDSPSATPRMASWACSSMAIQHGVEPVMQIAARDRTRVGLQAEVLGANAMGIKNILCLSGDNMKMAPEPRGRMDILDIDSIQMLWILRRMRDEGHYLDGREMKFPPKYFLGAAASPYASDPRFQAIREHKKVNAGAQFFQTNLVFDPDRLEIWLNELAKRNILDKVYHPDRGDPPEKPEDGAIHGQRSAGRLRPQKAAGPHGSCRRRAPKKRACRLPWR